MTRVRRYKRCLFISFPYTRTRQAWLLKTPWFTLRVYPPVLPKVDWL